MLYHPGYQLQECAKIVNTAGSRSQDFDNSMWAWCKNPECSSFKSILSPEETVPANGMGNKALNFIRSFGGRAAL